MFMAQHGLSRAGQAAGQTIGYSVNRRTIDNERDKMVKIHNSKINSKINQGTKVS